MEERGDGNGRSTTATWQDKHRRMYDRATKHPFILSIRDGAVDFSAFKRWLGQDFIFVRHFLVFVKSVLLKAVVYSDEELNRDVLKSGLAALDDEIAWFKAEASKWGVDLSSVPPHETNLEYCRFLENLSAEGIDYAVSMTVLWAIETVYQESFSLCLENGAKTPAELLETCQRWGNTDFAQYCKYLQKIADRCLEKAPEDVLRDAEDAFTTVLEHEVHFWNMSSEV